VGVTRLAPTSLRLEVDGPFTGSLNICSDTDGT